MTKLIKLLSLAFALVLIPSYAFAEISLADGLSDVTALESSITFDMDMMIAGPGHPGPRGPHGPHGGPGPRHTGHVVHHYYYGPRPRIVHPVVPVVIVEQAATSVVVENNEDEEVPESRHREGSKFGFGIRGVGLTQSSIHLENGECIETKINGGAGWYLKFRPIRFVSVEFINDYIFGGYKNGLSGSYVRVPLSLGVRGHVFNYGMLDLYGVAAASVTFISLSDGYRDEYNRSGYDDTHFASWGGQFGAGISFVTGVFEFGFDFRYTVEQAPHMSIGGFVDSSKRIHGFLFAANLGFAL